MKKRKRDRHTLESDRKSRRKMMEESKPSASAARRFVHKAYQSYTVEDYIQVCRSPQVDHVKRDGDRVQIWTKDGGFWEIEIKK